MTTIDVSEWAKRNVWRTEGTGYAVRPGLRSLHSPDSGRIFVGGFSVQNGYTGEVWHYVFDVVSDPTSAKALRLKILDEDFTTFQTFEIGANVIPRVITHAVVEGEIIIASPDFPTLWGLVGSGVVLADTVASDNPSTTALPVPRGICSTWCNRVVICDGTSMFVSDPVTATGGSTRTYVAQNQNQRPAPIFGVHEGAGGQLVVCTSAGVYGLDASAAATGIVGAAGTDWRMLNHHRTYTHASTCVVRGRVWALSTTGYLLVDVENNDAVEIDEPLMPYAAATGYGPRIAAEDYRGARLLADDDGPVVASSPFAHFHDVSDNLRSWWTCAVSTFDVTGILRDPDGAPILLARSDVLAMAGNFDGDQLISSALADDDQPRGFFAGIIPTAPAMNPIVRHISFAASCVASSIKAFVRGVVGSADTTGTVNFNGLVIGTDVWGASTGVYQNAPLRSARLHFNHATQDVAVIAGAPFPVTRLSPSVDVDFSSSAPGRPAGRGGAS